MPRLFKSFSRFFAPLVFVFSFLSEIACAQDILELDPVELTEQSSYDETEQEQHFSERLIHAQHVALDSSLNETAGALAKTSGARLSDNGGRLQRQSLAYRGSASQDIVVLYRNVPINALSSSSADLALIPGHLLDSADVYSAGMTASSGAIGGLVNLNPRFSEAPLIASVSASSLKDFSLFGRGQIAFSRGGISGAVFGDYSPGRFGYYDAQDEYQIREHNAASRFGAQIDGSINTEIAEISAFSLYSRIDREEAGLSEYPSRYRYATQNSWIALNGVQGRFSPVKLGKALAVFELTASHRAAGDEYDNPTAFIGGAKTHSDYLENRTSVQLNAEFAAPKYSRTLIEIGVDFQKLSSDYLAAGVHDAQNHFRFWTSIGISEILTFWNDRILISAGLRMDWDVEETPLYSPFAAIVYTPLDSLQIWFHSSMGERSPSFDEKYYHTEYMRGSRYLKNQRSIGNELGIAWNPAQWLKISALGFYNLYSNLIRFMPVTPHLYEAGNISEAFGRGAEFSLFSNFWKGFSIAGSYAFTDAKTPQNEPMPTAARHHFEGSLAWDDEIWHAAFLVSYLSRIPRNMNGTNYAPDKLRLSLEASFRLHDQWRLLVSIQNLLDDRRAEDVLQRPIPGRHAWIGIEYR